MKRSTLTWSLVGLVAVAAVSAPYLTPRAHDVVTPPDEPIEMSVEPKAEPPQAKVTPRPGARVELVFVLDTTSSMSGLIEGAKETIWQVVNDFSSQEPRPEVAVGLVAYRDRGDAYVTQTTPITDDLDAIYGTLVGLQAQGGGDAPESVVQGLLAGVNEQPWSQEGRVFRSIFLVGDAPDKQYANEPSPREVVRRARSRDIFVNAIQCGSMQGTAKQFRSIAVAGEGVFRAVAQDGAVERLSTPYDEELDRLQRELSKTAIPWGSRAERKETSDKMALYDAAPTSTKASRASVLTKRGGKIVTGASRGDLLDDLREGRADLGAIANEDLPTELQALSAPQRQAEIDKRNTERARIQAEMAQVVAKRDAWVTEERTRNAKDAPSYDREVVDSSLEKMRALRYIK
ncbi:MAG: vWA domain-containing protein [Myxococcota bacterium]